MPSAAPAIARQAAAPIESPPPLLPWLLAVDAPAAPRLASLKERRALRVIDALLGQPEAAVDWVPRARSVIPQLMAMLRRPDLALPALADLVARDLTLTAEVMRSAAAAARAGAAGPPADLRQALARLGRTGLDAVIARVVLRPMFQGADAGLSARCGLRLWEHAEAKADHCRALAAADGVDGFDAYLAGLMHNSGWTVALHALDRSGLFAAASATSLAPSPGFSHALQRRCERLFGRVAASWQLTPALTAVATSAATPGGLAASALPLAALLRRADALTTHAIAVP